MRPSRPHQVALQVDAQALPPGAPAVWTVHASQELLQAIGRLLRCGGGREGGGEGQWQRPLASCTERAAHCPHLVPALALQQRDAGGGHQAVHPARLEAAEKERDWLCSRRLCAARGAAVAAPGAAGPAAATAAAVGAITTIIPAVGAAGAGTRAELATVCFCCALSACRSIQRRSSAAGVLLVLVGIQRCPGWFYRCCRRLMVSLLQRCS